MENNSQPFDAERIRHPDVAYEASDLSHRPVFLFFLVMGVVIVFVGLAMWGMFKYLGASEYVGHRSTNPIMTSEEQLKEIGGDPANSFPMPHLQPDAVADLNKFRISEEQWLNTYGWISHQQNTIHIPIEKAIDLMAASWPQQEQESAGTLQGASQQTAKSASGTMPAEKAKADDRGGNYGW